MAALEQFIQQLKSNFECFGRTLIGPPFSSFLVGVELVREGRGRVRARPVLNDVVEALIQFIHEMRRLSRDHEDGVDATWKFGNVRKSR